MKLVFRTSVKPIDWQSPNPLAPSAAAAAPAAWLAPPPADSSPTAAAAAAQHQQQAVAAGTQPSLQHEASHQQPQQQWVEQLPAPQQQQQRVTAPYGRCVVIYKKGDDLRQDQFILQVRLLGNTRLKCQGGRIHLIGVSGLSNPGVCRPVHFSKSSRSPGMHCTTRG